MPLFDGRIAEDSLLTGTWVSVGTLRAAIAAGAPLLQDVVIVGHDGEYLAAILFPNLEACRALAPDLPADAHADFVVSHPAVREKVQAFLDRLALSGTGSATHIARALLAEVPPSMDAGELTDKGTVNQRAVLRNRTALVEELYEEPPSPRVFIASGKRA